MNFITVEIGMRWRLAIWRRQWGPPRWGRLRRSLSFGMLTITFDHWTDPGGWALHDPVFCDRKVSS